MPGQGEEVMKEATAGLMQAAETDMQAAEMIAQSGNPEAAEMLKQSAALKMKAIEALGVGGGGQAMPQNTDVAGTGAQPVGPQTR